MTANGTKRSLVCELYEAKKGCAKRHPKTLPFGVCCARCRAKDCADRCLNTPEKCGKPRRTTLCGSRWMTE